MSIYYDEAQRSFERAERSYEDQEPDDASESDGVYTCVDCEELIPGGELYFEVDGKHYCEECMRSNHRHTSPYRSELG